MHYVELNQNLSKVYVTKSLLSDIIHVREAIWPLNHLVIFNEFVKAICWSLAVGIAVKAMTPTTWRSPALTFFGDALDLARHWRVSYTGYVIRKVFLWGCLLTVHVPQTRIYKTLNLNFKKNSYSVVLLKPWVTSSLLGLAVSVYTVRILPVLM